MEEKEHNCPDCGHRMKCCGAMARVKGQPHYYCTKPMGHQGSHVACSGKRKEDHGLLRWGDPFDVPLGQGARQ